MPTWMYSSDRGALLDGRAAALRAGPAKDGDEDVPVVALRPVEDSDLDALFNQMRDPASVLMAAFTTEDPDDSRLAANPPEIRLQDHRNRDLVRCGAEARDRGNDPPLGLIPDQMSDARFCHRPGAGQPTAVL